MSRSTLDASRKPSAGFELVLYDQHWLSGDEPPETDLCSHGSVHLDIGGQDVLKNKVHSWCTWSAAFHLLRTLDRDHTENEPVGEQMIPCCGNFFVAMDHPAHFMGCPNGVNWWVEHRGDTVRLFGVVRTSTSGIEFRGDSDTFVPFELYRAQIITFAQQIKTFYEGSHKVFAPSDSPGTSDKIAYEAVWSEFDQLLSRFQLPSAD